MDKYILNGKTPVKERNLLKWAKFMDESGTRRIAETRIGDVRITTVFRGISDESNDELPTLFETTIVGGRYDQHIERCSTYDQAEEMHKTAVNLVRWAFN